MYRNKILTKDHYRTTTHNAPAASMDRYIARFKIYPEHKQIVKLLSDELFSIQNQKKVLQILAIAEEYGVRPHVMFDMHKRNTCLTSTIYRNYIDCLDNTVITLNIVYSQNLENKRIFIYRAGNDEDYVYINSIDEFIKGNYGSFTSNFPKFKKHFQLPDIKKGKYKISVKYNEAVKYLEDYINGRQDHSS